MEASQEDDSTWSHFFSSSGSSQSPFHSTECIGHTHTCRMHVFMLVICQRRYNYNCLVDCIALAEAVAAMLQVLIFKSGSL